MKSKGLKKIIARTSIITLAATSMLACGEKNNSEISKDFNATGFPVVDESITLTAMTLASPANGNFNEMKQFKEVAEKTGVTVKFDQIADAGGAWEEKKNLTLASGDLPDMFFGGGISDTDIDKYGSNGMFLPLDDLIEKYAPNLKKILDENPNIKKQITAADGHIYSLFLRAGEKQGEISPNLFINKKWLDNLGLDVPKTTDDFYNVMKNFKEKDPNNNGKNDEIPFSFVSDNFNRGENSIFGAFGVIDYPNNMMIKDNKVVYVPKEDGYKEGIKWLSKLYKDGLIDNEIFTHTPSQYQSKSNSGDTVYGAFIGYFADEVVGNGKAKDEYIALEPLKGPNGDQLWSRNGYDVIDGGKFTITSKNPNPEATIRWVDELYDPEMSLRLTKGELGISYEKKDDKYVVISKPGETFSATDNAPIFYTVGYFTDELYDKTLFPENVEIKREIYNKYDKLADTNPLPSLKFKSEELDEMATITTDLSNYVKEMKAKWVTGQRDVDKDWNEYITTLNNMRADKLIKIYNDALNRYNE